MLKNRKKLITKFLNEGFTHRTLSLFSDKQLMELGKKVFKEQESKEKEKQAYEDLISAKEDELSALKLEIPEDTTEEEEEPIEVTPHNEPIIKIDKDGKEMTLLGDGELDEDFASKAQQKYLYAVNPEAAKKLASKMTKKDYKNLPDRVTEQELLENWILDLLEKKEPAAITKGTFLKTIKEQMNTSKLSEQTIGNVDQEDSFNMINDIAGELTPRMSVVVDNIDDGGHLNGYLQSDDVDKVIDLNICPMGNIKLDGNAVGEVELTEIDRDDEGEYVGAPKATTAPAPITPLKTPTIAPSKPGEKKRRGPFERPKTTPKPKAKNKSTLPSWLTSTNLGKALTQHG